MKRRIVGAIFCLISAILYGCKYLCAAIFMSNVKSWSTENFQAGLEYVGSPLTIISVVALLVGIGSLVMAEIESYNSRSNERER